MREYEVDPNDLSAETVAAKIGMPLEQVFKTLVVRGDRAGILLAVIPGDCEVDGKLLAKLTGDRRVEMVPLKDVQPLTGHVRGGVTAIGQSRGYAVYLEELAGVFDTISVSAGVRGTQILLAPGDFIKATGAVQGSLSKEKPAQRRSADTSN